MFNLHFICRVSGKKISKTHLVYKHNNAIIIKQTNFVEHLLIFGLNTFDSFYMLLITIGLDTSSSKLENFLLHYFNTKQYSIFKLAAIPKGSSIYFGSSNLFEREFWFNIILTLFGLSLKIVYVTAHIFVTNTVCTARLYQWYV